MRDLSLGRLLRADAGLEFFRLPRGARNRRLLHRRCLVRLFIKLQPGSTRDAGQARLFRNVALLIPFAHVLFCTMVAWDFEMTLTPGWSSAIYAMYHFVSSFGMVLSVIALTVMLLMHKFVSPRGRTSSTIWPS